MIELSPSTNYIHVGGIPYTEKMEAADMHVHVTGDTADTPKSILHAAKRSGLQTVIITDHDSLKSYAECLDINEQDDLGLNLIPGVESTALLDGKNASRWQPKHVLVYGVNEVPPCYMPIEQLNAFVHDQGGFTSAAHPGLGRFSLTQEEIVTIQNTNDETNHFDFAEVHNGGVSLLNRFATRHPRVTNALVRTNLMPEPSDYNAHTVSFLDRMKKQLHLTGITAGSDSHDRHHIGEVAVFYDPGVGLFDSIKKGRVAIGEKKKLSQTNAKGVILGTIGGWRLEIARRFKTGWNGVTVYENNKA